MMVAFCNKMVWCGVDKKYRKMLHPYCVFTKEPIEPGVGLIAYEERMYMIVG